RKLCGQFFRLLAAESRAARCTASHLREATRRNRQAARLHPPQHLWSEERPGRRPPQKTRAHRTGAIAARNRRAADGVSQAAGTPWRCGVARRTFVEEL